MRFLLSCFLPLLLVGCSSPAPAETNDAVSNPTLETSAPAPGVVPNPVITGAASIELTGLSGYPAVVEGCGCALSLDAEVEDDGSAYLFVYNDDDGPGVIGIDGNEVELMWMKDAPEMPSEEDVYTYVHENDAYRVFTRLYDEGPSGDSGRIYSGTVRVTVKETGLWKEARIVGDCAC